MAEVRSGARPNPSRNSGNTNEGTRGLLNSAQPDDKWRLRTLGPWEASEKQKPRALPPLSWRHAALGGKRKPRFESGPYVTGQGTHLLRATAVSPAGSGDLAGLFYFPGGWSLPHSKGLVNLNLISQTPSIEDLQFLKFERCETGRGWAIK